MEIEIREIEVEDYKELLDFMKKVKGETNFLLFMNLQQPTLYSYFFTIL